MATNVHAVVVGVESTEAELHADNVGDGAAVLDVPALVVADSGDPAVAVRVVLVHEGGGLLSEGLAGGVPVLEREELVEDGVEDAADGLAGAARVVANDLRVGRGGLALLEVGQGGEVEDLGGYAVLLYGLGKRNLGKGMWVGCVRTLVSTTGVKVFTSGTAAALVRAAAMTIKGTVKRMAMERSGGTRVILEKGLKSAFGGIEVRRCALKARSRGE